ncbi:MAG: AraC family transcriptional regulator [Sphingomonadales bacterium]|jgi:AraC-like DNA-binding protein
MMAYWDGVARGAAGAWLLLLLALFARDWRAGLVPRFGVLLAASGIAYLVLTHLGPAAQGSGPGLLVHALSVSGPAWFWLFASALFDDEFALRPWHWLGVALAVLTGLQHEIVPLAGPHWDGPFVYGWRVISLGLVLAGLATALRGRDADLVEGRRRLRLALVGGTGLGVGAIVLLDVTIKASPPPLWWQLSNALVLVALAGGLVLAMLSWRWPDVMAPPPTAEAPRPEADDSALLARMDALMQAEYLWRTEGLSITGLAARLGVPEYRLRRAINQGRGARNFNAYVNGLRIAEAAAALADPAQREVPVLTIALDAGFGSLAPFNRAFRTEMGCTPSEWRAKNLPN